MSAEFDKRAACVENQYDDYVAVDDVHINGKLTLGENIADLGGHQARATRRSQRAENGARRRRRPLGGFTPEQQFFLGFAQAWCTNYRPEALRLLVATNPHSPPQVPRQRAALEPAGVRRARSSARRARRWWRLRRSAARSGDAGPPGCRRGKQ